ncbi:MAG TPA: SDR family NAD(P)-dependent oxidoreductase [Solirubrobacteraceae bacterium]|nr:SDR family NAD(P)-dependent oxidoreductase [Solirubrobacteraceae bacterium]
MTAPGGELAGRVALVTGGGRGIGRAAAIALAGAGARVMAVARTREQLDTLGREPRIATHVASLETPAGCRDAVRAAQERLGPVDVLVGNAGIGSAGERPIHEQDPEVWSASMAINLQAPFELMRLLTPSMVHRGFGRIVVVSSTAGLFGGAAMTAYCASKHAVIGLVRAAAVDLAPFGVTCNAVCPGWVRTEMSEALARVEAERRGVSVKRVWEERLAGCPAGRAVAPEEVAAAIRFLAGPAASGISGETITVALASAW